jgi:hypothetical protein
MYRAGSKEVPANFAGFAATSAAVGAGVVLTGSPSGLNGDCTTVGVTELSLCWRDIAGCGSTLFSVLSNAGVLFLSRCAAVAVLCSATALGDAE